MCHQGNFMIIKHSMILRCILFRFLNLASSAWLFSGLFLLVRTIEGIGTAMFQTASLALIPDLYPKSVATLTVSFWKQLHQLGTIILGNIIIPSSTSIELQQKIAKIFDKITIMCVKLYNIKRNKYMCKFAWQQLHISTCYVTVYKIIHFVTP